MRARRADSRICFLYLLRRAQGKIQVRRAWARGFARARTLEGITLNTNTELIFLQQFSNIIINGSLPQPLPQRPSAHAVIEPHGHVAMRFGTNLVQARLVHHIIIKKSQRIRLRGIEKRSSGYCYSKFTNTTLLL